MKLYFNNFTTLEDATKVCWNNDVLRSDSF